MVAYHPMFSFLVIRMFILLRERLPFFGENFIFLELRGTPVVIKTVEFQAGRTLGGFICSLSQPSLKFLEFLLVAPWSDQSVLYI